MKTRVLLLIFWLYVAGFQTSTAQAAENTIAKIKRAVSRHECFEVYWYLWNLRQGVPLPMRIKVDGEKFFVWIEGSEIYRGDRSDEYLIGTINKKTGLAAVDWNEGYNANLTPPLRGFVENRRKFETADVITETLTIPKDCTPRYDPPTAEKQSMQRTVIDTVRRQIQDLAKRGIGDYPKTLTLIVANFNVDYPYAFVWPESQPEFFIVSLRNAEQFGDKLLYPIGVTVIDPSRQEILAKIRKHGIKRIINVGR